MAGSVPPAGIVAGRGGLNSSEGRETMRTVVTAVLALAIVVGAFIHLVWYGGDAASPFVAWGGVVVGFWFGARSAGGIPSSLGPAPGQPARRASDSAAGGVL